MRAATKARHDEEEIDDEVETDEGNGNVIAQWIALEEKLDDAPARPQRAEYTVPL